MNSGTIGTRMLKNSVIKHLEGIKVGQDFSVLEEDTSFSLISAMGFSDISGPEGMTTGEVALNRALNNLSLSGALIEGFKDSANRNITISISIVAGRNCEEQDLRSEMQKLSSFCKKQGIKIIGGNTAFSGEDKNYSVTITAYGYTDRETLKQVKAHLTPGDKVIIIGNAGEYGANLLAEKCRDELMKRFSESYIDENIKQRFKIFSGDIAALLIKNGASFVHDVSYGGIYRALQEISEYSGLGIQVEHESIPIRQSTIEVCEYLNINPYKIMGTGGLVAVCKQDKLKDVIAQLTLYNDQTDKISFSEAGELLQKKECIIFSERNKTRRSLTYYDEDSLFIFIH